MTGLAMAGLLAAGPWAASAADEQATLQALWRDTGVAVEKLQEQMTAPGFSYGGPADGAPGGGGPNCSFEDVSRQFKGGQPGQEIAGVAGLTLKDVARMLQRHRQAEPQS